MTREDWRDQPFGPIVEHYEACLAQYGDCHRGVDWPRADDVARRHAVMLGVLRPGCPGPDRPARLLDLGCGAGHFYDFLRRSDTGPVYYAGLDVSERFIALCRSKYPEVPFFCRNLLADPGDLPGFEYVIMNGVFTEKRSLTFTEMFDYFRRLVAVAFQLAEVGIAFNVMSKQVDWERDDLFHLPLDELAWFLKREVSRHFVIRNDYGLYEYTAYVYREPVP
jgi:SAM-dependent methyltransferase